MVDFLSQFNKLISNIINFTATNRELKEPLILNTTITLGYDLPWRKVHDVLKQAALATNNISHEFKPFVLQTALNDFYVSYELKAYTLKFFLRTIVLVEMVIIILFRLIIYLWIIKHRVLR